MSNVNDFIPFCGTDTGTNLPTQSAYVASAARPIGNQPGIASSILNNKALRQSTYVVGQLAQFISNQANVSVLDDSIPAKLLSQIGAAIQPLAPVLTNYLSGSGNWHGTYYFFIASGSATAAATYTNNAVTFTVVSTIATGTLLQVTGSGDPSAGGGTLTKASGTGDASLTYYAFRKAAYIRVRAIGGGGGGAGELDSGSDGSDTTFGTTLISGDGGAGAITGNNIAGGAGGAASLGTGPVGLAFTGSDGAGSGSSTASNGSTGGGTPFGGGGGGGAAGISGSDGVANTGAGAGGAGGDGSHSGRAAGGAGGFVDAVIYSPASTYPYVIGAGGAGGISSGLNGGNGGSGLIQVVEYFQ